VSTESVGERVARFLSEHPAASANDVVRGLEARRTDVLAAVRAVRAVQPSKRDQPAFDPSDGAETPAARFQTAGTGALSPSETCRGCGEQIPGERVALHRRGLDTRARGCPLARLVLPDWGQRHLLSVPDRRELVSIGNVVW
jgi:hypothetical protein